MSLSGVCFHRLGVMLPFCCSRFWFGIDDIIRLIPAELYKHFYCFISCDLIRTTLVLLEIISVLDGAFCFDQIDDDLMRSFNDCICIDCMNLQVIEFKMQVP